MFQFRDVKKPAPLSVVTTTVSDEKCGSFSAAKELFRRHNSVHDDEVIFAGEASEMRREERETERERATSEKPFWRNKKHIELLKVQQQTETEHSERKERTVERETAVTTCTHGWA